MTVNTTTSRQIASGDGVSTTFAVPFYFLQNSDLAVYVGGAPQAITTNYTVSGAGNPAGGSVTFVTAPATGTGNVVIVRDPDQYQSTKYPANDPFPAKSHETALDKLTMLVQRTRDLIGRAVGLPDSDSNLNTTLPPAAARANTYLAFDAAGNLIASPAPTGGLTVSAAMTPVVQAATIPIAQTALALTPGTAANNMVKLDAAATLAPYRAAMRLATITRNSATSTQLGVADCANLVLASTSYTQSLLGGASLGAGWFCEFRNTGTGIVVLTPAAGTIDGLASINAYRGESFMVVSDGTNLYTVGRQTGLILIDRKSGGGTSYDFTQGIDSTFNEYVVRFSQMIPATNDDALMVRYSTDGGATFISSASSYLNNYMLIQNGTANPNALGDTYCRMSTSCSNTASDGGVNGDASFYGLSNSSSDFTKWFKSCSTHYRSATGPELFSGGGRCTSSIGAVTALRIGFLSGSISSGVASLYGLRNS